MRDLMARGARTKNSRRFELRSYRSTGRFVVIVAVAAALLLVAPMSAQADGRASESFAWFQWFVGASGGGFTWFQTGDTFDGPVHVNGYLQIDGDPWFGDMVTAGGGLTMTPGSDPTFVEGYLLHVDRIQLPTVEEIHSSVRDASMYGGLFAPSPGADTYYEVELGTPSIGLMTYGARDEYGNPIGLSMVVDIWALNGAAWFEESIEISGVLAGELTIGVKGTISIVDDILYADSTPGSGPNPSCTDILGLIATTEGRVDDGKIIVSNTVPNQSDCEIHAVMMAPEKYFEVEDFQHDPPRGDLIVYGGIIANLAILTGEYDNGGLLISGYNRDLHYDARMPEYAPPFFPEGSFPVGVPEVTSVSLSPSRPNPFVGDATFRFSTRPGSSASVDVYDVSGRHVASIFNGIVHDGTAEARWDALDRTGEPAARGVYFVRLRSGGSTATTKSVLLRRS